MQALSYYGGVTLDSFSYVILLIGQVYQSGGSVLFRLPHLGKCGLFHYKLLNVQNGVVKCILCR
ncbi:MAG: hypothetical protein FD130_247 [Halothiobacillaceae bacterium]|nr:MAG: hypothetical protein FD130_247 [Halothiobacillaceae bacterium]